MTDPSPVRHLRAQDAQCIRWRNGQGWTREIHAEAGVDSEEWRWRLSIADIDRPAAFSRFEGVDRELMLLSGDGLTLRLEDGQVADLQPPHARLRFAGSRALHGEPAGPGVSALNLMWRAGCVDASVWHRPLLGTMVVFVDPGDCWVVHVLAGEVGLAETDVVQGTRGDTLLLRATDSRRRFGLDGGGELLLVRFAAVDKVAPEEEMPAAP
ncbi:HutD family protein [Luteimonas sp. XNQY3]|nr:HutD family protein [Luteimonas sp. XNQY3]MCD9005256.1 HutD family protein [Luteimonas sp. XNQY3]